jgi:Ca2+-binding RTX toxin-like protein
MGRLGTWIVMMTFVAFPITASAAWPADDCPSTYSGLSCSVGGTAVCTDEGSYIDCHGFDSANAEPDDLWAITGTDEAIIWGTSNYTDFCCHFDTDAGVIKVETYGGGDFIALNYTDGTRYDWEGTSTLESGGGDDEVHGSAYACGVFYCDTIYVGYGDDEAYGLAGKDSISAPADDTGDNYFRGGNGNDRLLGGAGTDWLYGDPGDDLIRGRDGSDYLWGGNGEDRLNGDEGADGVFGGLGDDILCGDDTDDGDDDHLNGQDGANDECYDGLEILSIYCDINYGVGPDVDVPCPF